VLSTKKPRSVSENSFLISVRGMAVGQQFFIADKGYMGMGNPRVGDKVFVLIGSTVMCHLCCDPAILVRLAFLLLAIVRCMGSWTGSF
jgi:hypothetical protein